MAAWLRKLGEMHRGEIYIDDPSQEVFWNLRECGNFKQLTMMQSLKQLENCIWNLPSPEKSLPTAKEILR